MAKEKSSKIASKKHLARLERERRQTQLITYIAISIIVVIAVLIGYGILNETILKYLQPVVTVNGESVTMREFQLRVKIARQQYVDQYMQYYQLAQMFGMDPTTDPSMSQTLNQIQSQLSNTTQIGQQVIDDITNDLIIRQYAKANGVTLTNAELDKAIQDGFGYFPDGTPTPTPTSKPLTYPTWSATQFALLTPTTPPTLAPTVPTPTQTFGPIPTATNIPSLTPTATPYTLEGFQGRYKEGLSFYTKLGMTEADFRKIFFESNLYRQRVSSVVTANVTHEQEQVWVRHILVADEATAQNIRTQLLTGSDFATLAATHSLDTSNKNTGGDLGWFGKGKMVIEFETAAFAMQVGEISQPVKTINGWHIIQVLGHEIRPLTETEYQAAVTAAFNLWLTDQRSSATIVVSSNWTANTPNLPSLESAFADMNVTATAYANQSIKQPTSTPTP
jgi:peptidyl-prolyl cis-trans isomerase D